MIYALIGISLAALAFAAATTALAIRRSALISQLEKLRADYAVALEDAARLMKELAGQMELADADLGVLESRLESCQAAVSALPDTDSSRGLVLGMLDGLLSGEEETADADSDD